MNEAAVWAAIALAGAGTYAIRLSFLALFSRLGAIPPGLSRALRMVPAAVLAALTLPAFVRPAGSIDLSPDNLRLLAGLVALGVAFRFRNMLATIAVGMGVLWGLDYLV